MTSSRTVSIATFFVLAWGVGIAGCDSAEPTGSSSAPAASAGRDEGPLVVYSVSFPLHDFARRIGGPDVEAHFPVPRDWADPATWSPDADIVSAYQLADLVLLNGGEYARWVRSASLRNGRLVDTSGSFSERKIPVGDAETHAHGPDGEHVNTGVATTFWLDFDLARDQARTIAEAFAAERPGLAAEIEKRAAALDADLVALGLRLGEAFSQLESEAILFSHPVYQYLERRYVLDGYSLQWEPDEMPNEEQWSELEELLGSHPAGLMLWEAEPGKETRRRLESLGVEVVVFETAAGWPAEGEFLEAMSANVERLQGVSRGGR
jgi:zinc transport system substrate-binding protein